MAPPRKHETDAILDATRDLVLAHGPRAASVAAIAKASGAPAGTLYHRFGNRDGVVTAAWLRALERFQSRALAAQGGTALDTATAMAVSAVGFARELPDDARLLLSIRPDDLRDGQSDAGFTTDPGRHERPADRAGAGVGRPAVRAQRYACRRRGQQGGGRSALCRRAASCPRRPDARLAGIRRRGVGPRGTTELPESSAEPGL